MEQPITSTKNYRQFSLIKGNRAINNLHVNRLCLAISKNNLLKNNPITVTPKMEVVDGQHRLEAAKRLGVAIYYTKIKEATIETVQQLNTVTRTWKGQDYLNSFIERDFTDYKVLKVFLDTFNLPLWAGIQLTRWETVGGNHYAGFKAGLFQIGDLPKAYSAGAVIKKLIRIAPNKKYIVNRAFIRAIILMINSPKYDQDIFLKKIKQGSFRFFYTPDVNECLVQLENIYNYKSRKVVRFI